MKYLGCGLCCNSDVNKKEKDIELNMDVSVSSPIDGDSNNDGKGCVCCNSNVNKEEQKNELKTEQYFHINNSQYINSLNEKHKDMYDFLVSNGVKNGIASEIVKMFYGVDGVFIDFLKNNKQQGNIKQNENEVKNVCKKYFSDEIKQNFNNYYNNINNKGNLAQDIKDFYEFFGTEFGIQQNELEEFIDIKKSNNFYKTNNNNDSNKTFTNNGNTNNNNQNTANFFNKFESQNDSNKTFTNKGNTNNNNQNTANFFNKFESQNDLNGRDRDNNRNSMNNNIDNDDNNIDNDKNDSINNFLNVKEEQRKSGMIEEFHENNDNNTDNNIVDRKIELKNYLGSKKSNNSNNNMNNIKNDDNSINSQNDGNEINLNNFLKSETVLNTIIADQQNKLQTQQNISKIKEENESEYENSIKINDNNENKYNVFNDVVGKKGETFYNFLCSYKKEICDYIQQALVDDITMQITTDDEKPPIIRIISRGKNHKLLFTIDINQPKSFLVLMANVVQLFFNKKKNEKGNSFISKYNTDSLQMNINSILDAHNNDTIFAMNNALHDIFFKNSILKINWIFNLLRLLYEDERKKTLLCLIYLCNKIHDKNNESNLSTAIRSFKNIINEIGQGGMQSVLTSKKDEKIDIDLLKTAILDINTYYTNRTFNSSSDELCTRIAKVICSLTGLGEDSFSYQKLLTATINVVTEYLDIYQKLLTANVDAVTEYLDIDKNKIQKEENKEGTTSIKDKISGLFICGRNNNNRKQKPEKKEEFITGEIPGTGEKKIENNNFVLSGIIKGSKIENKKEVPSSEIIRGEIPGKNNFVLSGIMPTHNANRRIKKELEAQYIGGNSLYSTRFGKNNNTNNKSRGNNIMEGSKISLMKIYPEDKKENHEDSKLSIKDLENPNIKTTGDNQLKDNISIKAEGKNSNVKLSVKSNIKNRSKIDKENCLCKDDHDNINSRVEGIVKNSSRLKGMNNLGSKYDYNSLKSNHDTVKNSNIDNNESQARNMNNEQSSINNEKNKQRISVNDFI